MLIGNKLVKSVNGLPYWNYFVDLKINDEKTIKIFKSMPCDQVHLLVNKPLITEEFFSWNNAGGNNNFTYQKVSFKYIRS